MTKKKKIQVYHTSALTLPLRFFFFILIESKWLKSKPNKTWTSVKGKLLSRKYNKGQEEQKEKNKWMTENKMIKKEGKEWKETTER